MQRMAFLLKWALAYLLDIPWWAIFSTFIHAFVGQSFLWGGMLDVLSHTMAPAWTGQISQVGIVIPCMPLPDHSQQVVLAKGCLSSGCVGQEHRAAWDKPCGHPHRGHRHTYSWSWMQRGSRGVSHEPEGLRCTCACGLTFVPESDGDGTRFSWT